MFRPPGDKIFQLITEKFESARNPTAVRRVVLHERWTMTRIAKECLGTNILALLSLSELLGRYNFGPDTPIGNLSMEFVCQ
jgi:hypothetical protein